jgi:hypothetical protein
LPMMYGSWAGKRARGAPVDWFKFASVTAIGEGVDATPRRGQAGA